jgi:hypothetical protein
MEAQPTPESSFIAHVRNNMPNIGPSSSSGGSNILRQGELAQKLQAMQAEKNKAAEDRKLAILEAKYAARMKKSEEAAAKRIEQEKKKTEQAAARAKEIAEKKEMKKMEAEINKKAKAETRRIIAEVRNICV